MFPLKDENPHPPGFTPKLTILLILINVAVFGYEVAFTGQIWEFSNERAAQMFFEWGAVPACITGASSFTINGQIVSCPNMAYVSLVSSIFMHGGLMHLGGNMLFLWIFGDNIEGYLGHSRFLMFYLLCGLVAVFTHIFLSGISEIPMVGASGAVSGLLGAYLVKYPKARVLVVIPIVWFLTIRKIPAYVVLGFWFAMQLFYALSSLGISQGGGVAFWAHIGGFAAGIVLIYLFPAKKLKVSSN